MNWVIGRVLEELELKVNVLESSCHLCEATERDSNRKRT